MDYFAFYDMPRSFRPDLRALKRKYYQFSKQFHPDYFTLDDAAKQSEILEQSTLNNQAYRTLSDSDRRMAYLLRLEGVLAEGDGSSVPQAFLVEMMDINEGLMELEFGADPALVQQVRSQLEALETDLETELQPAMARYETEPAGRAAALGTIKEIYLKRKYLLRIRENLNKFAAAKDETSSDTD